MTHQKRYVGSPSGGGKIVCSCGGFETPVVDDAKAFTMGIKSKTVDEYFREHLESVSPDGPKVETTMMRPTVEKAVAAAQRPLARLSKALSRKKSNN
jgi:hypothetical protein